jgi:hypothetical protein
MSEQAANHRRAADRHQQAAESHERAARFWERKPDGERAHLQHAMAEYERQGAVLERRWADLVEHDLSRSASQAAEAIRGLTRQRVEQVCQVLTRLAATLEKSAELADQHAQRCVADGLSPAEEQDAATRARASAQRARDQAAEWVKVIDAGQAPPSSRSRSGG